MNLSNLTTCKGSVKNGKESVVVKVRKRWYCHSRSKGLNLVLVTLKIGLKEVKCHFKDVFLNLDLPI